MSTSLQRASAPVTARVRTLAAALWGMTWIRAAVASACVCFILPAGRVIFHSKEEVVLGVGDGWLDVLALQLSPTSAPSPSGVVSLVSDVSGV